MELRNGKNLPYTPTSRFLPYYSLSNLDLISELDCRSVINMTSNVTVVNTRSAITPFHGRIDGNISQSVESWIGSVEAHLVSNNIIEEELRIQAAKSFMDLAKGDLQDWVRSKYFESCSTWEALKSFLREIYGGDRFNTANMLIRSLILMSNRQGLSFIQNNAIIYDRTKEVIQRLAQSSWATTPKDAAKATTGYFISSENLQSLLLLAIQLASLPDALVSTFDVEFGPDFTEKDVVRQIMKHRGKIDNLDPSIMKQGDKTNTFRQIAVTNQRPQRPVEQGNSVKCNNCQRFGHVKKECKTKYCSYHNTTKHSYDKCRAVGNGPKNNNYNYGQKQNQQNRYHNRQNYNSYQYQPQQQFQQNKQQQQQQQQQHHQQQHQQQRQQNISYANVVSQSTQESNVQVTNPNTGAISKKPNFQGNQSMVSQT